VQKKGGGIAAQEARGILKQFGVPLLETEAIASAAAKAGPNNLHNLCYALNHYKGIHSQAYDEAVLAQLRRAVALGGGDTNETKRLIQVALRDMAVILESGGTFW